MTEIQKAYPNEINTDLSLIGTQAGELEDLQGVYAHAHCRPVASALAEVDPIE